MTADRERLDAITARTAAATPGPWEWDADSCSDDGMEYTPNRVWTHGGTDPFGEAMDDYVLASHVANEDAVFIAAARTDVEWLCDRVRDLTAENERLNERLARVRELGCSCPPSSMFNGPSATCPKHGHA